MPPVRRLTFDLSEDHVRAILGDIDPSLVSTGFQRLHGGSKEAWRLDLAGREPVVLKIYGEQPAWAPAKEALVAGRLEGDLGLPTPRWLRLDERRIHLPLSYAVMTWLPGRTVRDLISHPAVGAVHVQMGRWLRRLHAVRMEAYGYIVDSGIHDPRPSNAAFVTGWFERAFRRFRDLGGDAELGRRIEAAARARYGLLDHSAGPVFCHDDFQPGNLLAVEDGAGELRLSGLIDFGNALAGDAVFDLAKALFCCAHEDPRIPQALREGYGDVDHPEPEQALWLYTLLHRLIMWNWLRGLGDTAGAAGPAGLLRDLDVMLASS